MNELKVMKRIIKATWSSYSCLRGPRPSGAAVTLTYTHADKREISIHGFVQPSKGQPSCIDEGECMIEDGHCVRCLHAEVDAILRAYDLGFTLSRAALFSINKPCYNCTLHIIAADIKTIFYAYVVYDDERTNRALESAGVECIHVPVD